MLSQDHGVRERHVEKKQRVHFFNEVDRFPCVFSALARRGRHQILVMRERTLEHVRDAIY
jgi:hypothetical protein